MKTLFILLGIGVVGFAWYGLYKASYFLDLNDAQTTIVKKSAGLSQELQSWVNKAQSAIHSGIQMVGSGAQRLVASWQALLEQKKLEASTYIQQQKDALKQQTQKTIEDEAKKKIQGIFSGR
jgi:hypothetical protein